MIRKRYRCPSCARLFDYDHHPSIEADPLPEECPYECGFRSGAMPPGLVAPHLGSVAVVASVDNVIRGMEDGARIRAQMGQELHGMDTADAAQLHLTNQRDRLRPGDISAMPVNNQVTQMMAAAPPGTLGFRDGLGLSSAVSTGPYPNAGLRAMMDVKAAHDRVAGQVTGAAGSVFTADRPALETQQPGYRKRA